MNHLCLVRARAGDPYATEEIVAELRPRVTRMAAHYARRCREDADDLLQEAWAGLLEALAEIDPRIGDPEQYLLRTARWRLLDAVRRAYVRRCAPLEEIEEGREEADLLPAVEVARFVSRLSPFQRAVLAGLLAGLTWRETGTALGCTSANIAYHVRRIREQYSVWRSEGVEG